MLVVNSEEFQMFREDIPKRNIQTILKGSPNNATNGEYPFGLIYIIHP